MKPLTLCIISVIGAVSGCTGLILSTIYYTMHDLFDVYDKNTTVGRWPLGAAFLWKESKLGHNFWTKLN